MNIATFRAVLRYKIKKEGFTQEEFAEKIDIGLSTLKKYMNGPNIPDIEIFDRMCSALNCDYDYLFGKIDTPTKDIYDVKEVTGLSDEAVVTLKKTYEMTNYKIGKHKYPGRTNKERIDAQIREEEVVASLKSEYSTKLKTIDFILKEEPTSHFLKSIATYLFNNFLTYENNNRIKLLTESGIPRVFDANDLKGSMLTDITYQLQTWRKEIENSEGV